MIRWVRSTYFFFLICRFLIYRQIKKKKRIYICMMAVEQVCPHRLVVQDISLSRRQRGFDFPWG
ncbi:unnamed protein product [Arabidopsis lyrata]|uniref:Uncharacterized protein n=1 Tax=Arabidopsis lyrata subsp. lyrata TaxID=81972 RepID=D7KRC0_ARALL|nr:hypothetical protein ARALYDRAFT_893969 [Arabidopsis lyrata subsp. lyrata]CAH8269640.1 unnamed protein product [Arabidopsis lyrata]